MGEYAFRDASLDQWEDGPDKQYRVLFDMFCAKISTIYKRHGISTADLIVAHMTAQYVAPEVFQFAWDNLFALLDKQRSLFCPACDAAIRREIAPLQTQLNRIASL